MGLLYIYCQFEMSLHLEFDILFFINVVSYAEPAHSPTTVPQRVPSLGWCNTSGISDSLFLRHILVVDAAVSSHSSADTSKHCLKYICELQNAAGNADFIAVNQSFFDTSTAYEYDEKSKPNNKKVLIFNLFSVLTFTLLRVFQFIPFLTMMHAQHQGLWFKLSFRQWSC